MSDATVYVGGPSLAVAEYRGCTGWIWWSASARYVYHCDTAYYLSGEWQSTDYVYYQWLANRVAYLGTYRCVKDTGGAVVVIGSPSSTRCYWA